MEQIPGLRIRNMTDGDMVSIVEIDRKIVGADRDWPQRASSHFSTYHAPLSFIAEVEGKVVGFIIGDIRGAEYALPLSGWLDIMGVEPSYQGKGIGRKLMEAFVRGCRERGVKARVLFDEGNQRLKGFLTSAGFGRGNLVEFVRGFN
ncbi:MAG: GNAT family N-acetyltransferase [Chloroflexota bacterium]